MIFCIVGPVGSGKSTISNYISQNYEHDYFKIYECDSTRFFNTEDIRKEILRHRHLGESRIVIFEVTSYRDVPPWAKKNIDQWIFTRESDFEIYYNNVSERFKQLHKNTPYSSIWVDTRKNLNCFQLPISV